MNEPVSREIRIGDRVSMTKTITSADIEVFAEITGDHNPLHLDDRFAVGTVFKGRIAHGILTLGLISAALSRLPGTVVYLSQSARFVRPVRPGDTIEATAEVIQKSENRNEFQLKTFCQNQRGELVLDGEARIRVLAQPEE